MIRITSRDNSIAEFNRPGITNLSVFKMAATIRSLGSLWKNFRNLCIGTVLPSQTPVLGSCSRFTLQCRFRSRGWQLGKIKPLINEGTPTILNEVENETLIARVSERMIRGDISRLFAVVHIRGLQRKVTTEDLVIVHGSFPPNIGERIRLEKVLLVGSKDFTLIGKPLLSRTLVNVEATVIEKTLTHSKPCLNYRPRKNDRKFKLFKGEQTIIVINKIAVNPNGLTLDNSDIISVG